MANKANPAVPLLCNPELSEIAFQGQACFLMACADACDFRPRDDQPEPPPYRGRRAPRWTYFIGAEHGPIKIGMARNPYERLLGLQVGHPEELYIYAVEPGGVVTESRLHDEFAEERLRGEWFMRSERLIRRIIYLQEEERKRYPRLTRKDAA